MPKILILAATPLEIAPTLRQLGIRNKRVGTIHVGKNKEIGVLLTGVGMVNTAFHMGKAKISESTLLIQAGIAGAIDRQLPIGEVVCVVKDTLSEMGAEDGPSFLTYPQLGLGGTNTFKAKLPASRVLNELKKVRGITVNKVHGRSQSIQELKRYYKAEVESMEGAAFLMAATELHCKSMAIRSISNYVEKRDRSKWNIPLAVQELNKVLIRVIEEKIK